MITKGRMMVAQMKKRTNPTEARMTPAQQARAAFKRTLPRPARKPEAVKDLKPLTAMEALGQTFILLDRFRGAAEKFGADPEVILAELIYCLPVTQPTLPEATLTVPAIEKIGDFANAVLGLDQALFLGVLFLQYDPDTDNSEYKAVSFVAPFLSGPEAVSRMKMAQQRRLLEMEQHTLNSIQRGRKKQKRSA